MKRAPAISRGPGSLDLSITPCGVHIAGGSIPSGGLEHKGLVMHYHKRDRRRQVMRRRRLAWACFGAAAAGVAVVLAGPPVWLLDRVAAAFPGCLYRVPISERAVALTLDDGPDEVTTPLILTELRRHGARATFFLIGERARRHGELVRRLVEEGHEAGNHFMYDLPSVLLGEEELARGLGDTHEILERFGVVRWARPGSGWYTGRVVSAIARQGYRCALGSVYPWDAAVPSSGFATRHILRNVRPGAVIVLHEGGARGRRTARTLAAVLPELRRRGYRVVTLTELETLASPSPPLHRGDTGDGPRPTSTAPPQQGPR